MLHGEIAINGTAIGKWTAQRAGTWDGYFLYKCSIEVREMNGELKRRNFFTVHNYGDGAVTLSYIVLKSADVALSFPYKADEHARLDFRDANGLTDENLAPWIEFKGE